MYLPNSFVELIKEPSHLKAEPRNVVHQGQTPLSSFCVQI
jgi:hypothetical protein